MKRGESFAVAQDDMNHDSESDLRVRGCIDRDAATVVRARRSERARAIVDRIELRARPEVLAYVERKIINLRILIVGPPHGSVRPSKASGQKLGANFHAGLARDGITTQR